MKGLITFGVVAIVLVLAGYYAMGTYMASDDGELIAFACGNVRGEVQDLQIVVPTALPMRIPPKINPGNGYVFWDEWMAEHYIITSSTGERVKLDRKFSGNLIPDAKVGTPDSYLIGQVKTGVEYTFDFVPSVSAGKHYRHVFKVGDKGVPFSRENFALVKTK
jgi:hypothetical protein